MRLALCLSSVLFAACGSDDHGTFERASDLELQRTIIAATAGDILMVGFISASYASAPAGGCPEIAVDGDRRTVTGGCTMEDGTRVDGELILENVPGLFGGGNDPSKPQRVEANGFVVTDDAGPLAIDGTLTSTPSSTEADLSVELNGLEVATVGNFACAEGQCTYDSASLDVEGIGGAKLEGSFSFETNSISLDLTGRDHLQLRSDGECVAYVAGSRSGKVCNQQ